MLGAVSETEPGQLSFGSLLVGSSPATIMSRFRHSARPQHCLMVLQAHILQGKWAGTILAWCPCSPASKQVS